MITYIKNITYYYTPLHLIGVLSYFTIKGLFVMYYSTLGEFYVLSGHLKS